MGRPWACRVVLVGATALALGWALAGVGLAQPQTAEVRSRTGQVWHLAKPSLERASTLVWGEESPAPASTSKGSTTGMSATPQAPPGAPAKGHEVKQARRLLDTLTVHQGGTEIHIPLAAIRMLVLTREPVAQSPLPPYLSPSHFRYAASVMLNDGVRIQGDYINLGATVLRGDTRDGRVEIAWEEIESIRFGP